MPIKNGVVAHFADGRIVKGITHDFSPNRPTFHLSSPADGGNTAGKEIRCSDLKAVFFVRDPNGDPQRTELRGFLSGPAETVHGKKIAVLFHDGEVICGYSLTYAPEREGFFLFPADPASNNLRIFVIVSAAIGIHTGTAAEDLARRILNQAA